MPTIPDTMTALWLEDRRLGLRNDVPVPKPVADQALVRVHMAGICATDRHLIKGYYPYAGIPGHEFVGTVVHAPDDPSRVGQRVVGNINISCGRCLMCRTGLRGHCTDRFVMGICDWAGTMAQYLCLPLSNLVMVPEHVPDEAAVFAEPLAAALQIQKQINIDAYTDTLILGAGTLGQLVARSLIHMGRRLHVVARYEAQRGKLEAAGIDWVAETDVARGRYDLVIEASGSPQGFKLAQEALRPKGTMVLKSTFKGEVPVGLSELVVDEMTLIGSRCGPMDEAMAMLADQQIDPLPLIEESYPLQRGVGAFGAAAQPGKLKVLMRIGQ